MAKVTFDPIAAVALSECIPTSQLKKLKPRIKAGANAGFELTAKVEGRLTRGKPVEANATASILNEAIVGETIRRLGVDRAKWERTLLKVAREALVRGIPIKERLIEKDPDLLGTIFTVKKKIVDKLPKITKPGAIKVIADVDFTRCKVA